MKFLSLIAVFFIAGYSAFSQEVARKANNQQYLTKKKPENNAQISTLSSDEVAKMQMKSAEIIPEEVAKKETKNLHHLLGLNDEQTTKVYEICNSIEQHRKKISMSLDGDKKMSEINKLETVKTEKLKEVLTEDQFKIYLKSINNQR